MGSPQGPHSTGAEVNEVRERVTWQEDETQGYTNPYNLTPPFVLPWAENIQAADSGGSSVEPTECLNLRRSNRRRTAAGVD